MWSAAALAAWMVARLIPAARPSRPWLELLVALSLALAAGLAATALDFGGLREPDWRAGLFAFLTGFAALGVLRLSRRS